MTPPPVHLIDDVLPPAAIQAAYDALQTRQIPTSQVFVDPEDPVAKLGDFVALPLALLLSRYLERLHAEAVALGYRPAATFELWTNVTRSLGPTAFLHVDNDEVLREETGEVTPPEFGTILYVGPEGEFDGGETLIGEEEPSEEVRAEVLFSQQDPERITAALGESVTAVAPKRGRACIFRGSLPHCVMPFDEPAGGPRVTLLANGWVEPPRMAAKAT